MQNELIHRPLGNRGPYTRSITCSPGAKRRENKEFDTDGPFGATGQLPRLIGSIYNDKTNH
jgi:hypothetical protein